MKKKQRDNLSLNLTTDEVSDVALVTLRARASSQTKPLMPAKAQKASLAKSLDVFAITVEDSFDAAFLAHESELANYELRGAEAEKVKVVTRSERRRRRTFGAGARVTSNIESSSEGAAAFKEFQGAMDKAASMLDKHILGDDFKVRAAHSKSAPPPPTALDEPPLSSSQSLAADVNDSDVAQITAEMTKMNAAIKSSLDSSEQEGGVKMISVGEARRRRRRRTFDGKRPDRPVVAPTGSGAASSPRTRFVETAPAPVAEPTPDATLPSASPALRRAQTERADSGLDSEGEGGEKLRTKSMGDMNDEQ